MRTFGSPPVYATPAGGNLTDDVLAHLDQDPHRVLFRRPVVGVDAPAWEEVTAEQFHADVVSVAKGLVAAGVQPGDRVALLCSTRYEWTLLDYAIWWAGAVTVPIYDGSSRKKIKAALGDSAAVGCVVETPRQRKRVDDLRGELDCLEKVWTVDDGGVQRLVDAGGSVDADDLEKRRSSIGPESLATVVYTSGTTGRAKGCRLTHGNLMAEVGNATAALDELFGADDAATLLFLPLSSVFARVLQVGCVRTGTTLGHTADLASLPETLHDFRPTFLFAVPRVFETIFATAAQQATSGGRSRLFDAAVAAATDYSRALDDRGAGPLLRSRRALFDRIVYRRVRESLGGRARYALCGGGPLDERLGHFFRGAGVMVLEGYGMAESTGALTLNLPHETKMGSVGRPLPGVTVRVADDGELLFRGQQVFDGYWGDDVSTSPVQEGWLHTADVGEVDGEGFVRVTGRKHEILVTAGGKSVAPTVLEDRIRTDPLVGHCLVVGDGRPYVAALITLDEQAALAWAAANGRPTDLTELVDDPDLRDLLQLAVDAANVGISPAESVRRFQVLAEQWSEDTGLVTPSLKLRRAKVLRSHRREIEALYR